MKNLYLSILCFCLSILTANAQYFPGGVTDAEVWYIANWDDIGNGDFNNSALTDIALKNCSSVKKDLFNFNPSIYSEKLCLKYNAPLENSTGRDVFFVGKPFKLKPSLSHLSTLWNNSLSPVAETDSIIRNFMDLNNRNVYAQDIYDDFVSDKNANVNFYHTNHYNIDKKFKSYGQLGETEFYIGTKTTFDPQANYSDNHFTGSFPEFLSFTRELSKNERNRVESYLALKYGLTLSKNESYLNSTNRIFWDSSNNDLFSNRIFGFGKDETSSLNQLQSESTHLQKHLVAAIEKIMPTNMDKQESVSIPNNHFLVFGDNGKKSALAYENSKKIKFWEKVWLAERTGKKVSGFPIYFQLHLTDEIIDYLKSNDKETLWLMQDKFVSNEEVSDFEGEHIEYHPGDVNLDEGVANFNKIYFDKDQNIYDQYTFGVGPRMIVQAQVSGCKGGDIKITVVITGGKPKYNIHVESEESTFDIITTSSTYTFEGQEGLEYVITVTDSQGLESQMTITPELWNFDLDLGPNQTFSPSNPEIVLDAGANINDPDATYQWYKDGVLLAFTGSALIVTEAGDYKVIVTSGDLACTEGAKITIFNNAIEAHISVINGCGDEYNTIAIDIDGGMPSFITSLEGINGTVNYAHSASIILEDIEFGTYTLTITDSQGVTYEEIVTFPLPIDLDIYTQLEEVCGDNYPYYCINYDYSWDDISHPFFNYNQGLIGSFVLDASNGNSNPNITYEWWENGELIGTNPIMTFTEYNYDCYEDSNNPNSAGGNPIYIAIATDNFTGCVFEQTFITKGICADGNTNSIVSNTESVSAEESINDSNDSLKKSESNEGSEVRSESLDLTTKVYPNPANSKSTFTYKVESEIPFDGIVEIFTISGERMYNVNINGEATYLLPFIIDIPGIYIIKITSSIGVSKIERIIIN